MKRPQKEFLKAMKKKFQEDNTTIIDDACPDQTFHEYALREIHPTLITWGKP